MGRNRRSAHKIFERNSKTLLNVARNLRAIRMFGFGYSLARVSEETGIPKGSIGCYEFDGRISDTRLEQLAAYYEIPATEFVKPEDVFYKKYIKDRVERSTSY